MIGDVVYITNWIVDSRCFIVIEGLIWSVKAFHMRRDRLVLNIVIVISLSFCAIVITLSASLALIDIVLLLTTVLLLNIAQRMLAL